MNRILKWMLISATVAMAAYGLFRFVSDRLDYSHGKQAVESAHPFVQGVSSAAGEKIKQTLKETPDAKLEEDAELLSRKLYPIVKGAVKGQMDAVLNDPNRAEIPEKMVQTGKEIAESVIKPLSEGVAQGSQKVFEDLDKGLGELRKFQEKNKDLIEGLQSGISAIRRQLENPSEDRSTESSGRDAGRNLTPGNSH